MLRPIELACNGDRVYFMLGDVSGKGVAASLLMAQSDRSTQRQLRGIREPRPGHHASRRQVALSDAVQAIIVEQQQFRGDCPNVDDLTIRRYVAPDVRRASFVTGGAGP